MTAPTDTPPPPPDAKARPPRAPRPRKSRRSTWLVGLGALAVFGGVLAYTMSRTPPFPTNHECMVMGGAIEGAKSAADLQTLLAPEAVLPNVMPALSSLRANPDGLAAAVWQLRQGAKYTFVRTLDQRTPDQRLCFRVHSPEALLDFHDYRLERRDGVLYVADVRLLTCDVWLSELDKECRRLDRALPSGTLRALGEASAAGDVPKVRAIAERVPPSARPSLLVDLLVLAAHLQAEVPALHAAAAEFRTAYPDHAAADMLVLQRAQIDLRAKRLDEALRRDAIGAVHRLEKRIDDAIWLQLHRFFEQ